MERKLPHEKIAGILDTFGHLSPVLQNFYQRSYYETMDKKFRATIDRELRFQQPGILPVIDYDMAYDVSIIEIKYDKIFEDEADEVTDEIPFQRTKYSKYVEGIRRVFHS